MLLLKDGAQPAYAASKCMFVFVKADIWYFDRFE